MKNTKLLGTLGILGIMAAGIFGGIRLFNQERLTAQEEAASPQVVAQSPAAGERLEPGAPIEIQFDREMDQQVTGGSLTVSADGQAVGGRVDWKDGKTVIFTPESKLAPGTVYTVKIAQATSQKGSMPEGEILLDFKTTEKLVVGQAFPMPEALDVDLNTSITVIFNHPVAALTGMADQGSLPQPLTFTPAVKGSGEWVNSSVYVFQPTDILLSGTRYQVEVAKGLKDTLGNELEEAYRWSFETRAPQIANFALKDGEQNPTEEVKNVALEQEFVVSFLQPMEQASVEKATEIVNMESNQAVPLRFKWDKAGMEMTVRSRDRLAISSFYRLTLADSAQAADGGKIREGLRIQFATVQKPAVAMVYPPAQSHGEYNQGIVITFSAPMDFDSLKGRVKISPAIPGEPEWYYNSYDYSLTINGLEAGTDYVVRILPGMADPYGNTIKDEMSYTFHNGDYSPYAWLALPWTPLVHRAAGPQEIYFEHLNTQQTKVAVYKISEQDYFKLSGGEIQATDFKPAGQAVREWAFTGEARRNVLERETLQLRQNGRPLENGMYFIGVQSNSFQYETNFYQGALFMVATDNLTLKSTASEALAWLTDLESGAPQEGLRVRFYDYQFHEIGEATSDKDGMAYREGIASASYAVAEGEGHYAFTALQWGSGVWAGDFGIYEDYYSGLEQLYGYLYTDRAVYRPGQDVFFKGILRQNDDLHYSLPKLKTVHVVVEQFGNKIYSKDIAVNALGSFNGAVSLGDEISLGSYTLYAYPDAKPESSPISAVDFSVAEYKKPEFEVRTQTDKKDILVGGSVRFGLDAEYYSGGKLKQAATDWFIESANYYFEPAPKYRTYSFMDWERDVYWQPDQYVLHDTVNEGQGKTDTNGHLEIQQTFGGGKDKVSQQMTFHANVTDVAGNTVSGSTSVVVHQSEYYAGIRSNSYVGRQGEAMTFGVVVLGWNSEAMAGKKVTVELVEREWFSVQEKDSQGQLTWVTTVKETPAGQVEAVTRADGTAEAEFIPTKGGGYKALVTVKDSRGNRHQASTYVWVAGSGEVAWRQTNDRAFKVIADKDLYEPGETAKILIAQPFGGKVNALVTYERGHIYKREVVQLEGTSTIYELPITDELAPIAYFSVTVIQGAEAGGAPDFKIGMATLNIDSRQKALQVSVKTDKTQAGPGDKVRYQIFTKDAAGKAVAADVSIAVVDKAVLALAGSNSIPMMEGFYPARALGVTTALGMVTSADDFNADYQKSIPSGQAQGGGGGGELGIITVRQTFKDTALFQGEVRTDENGEAEVTVELPENLTTWVADVRAITADSLVGEASHELVSSKPMFVQLQTPRFFVGGDKAKIGATIFNNTQERMEVRASLEAEGVELGSPAEQSLWIEGEQQGYVTWDVTVKGEAERVDLTATVSSGALTDASKPAVGSLTGQGIPVLRYTTREVSGGSGSVTGEGSVMELVQLPKSVKYEDARLKIEVAPSLTAALPSGLDYLKDYPYLCMEQTISRFLPNVISARALQATGDTGVDKGELDAQVSSALQRIYAKQLYDGGWNWWDGDTSDPQTSAYVVLGLLEARESGYTVSDSALENGIGYLQTNLPELGRNDATWMFNRQAFVYFVLARAGALEAGQTNFLYEQRASLGLYGKAYLAQTMDLLKDKRAKTLLSDLVSAAIPSAAGAHWEEGEDDPWNWNTDIRTTAIVLNAFAQMDAKNPLTANAVRWLMAHRESGHWASTQETAWSLMALTNWLVESKENQAAYTFAVGLNNRALYEGEAQAGKLEERVTLEVKLEDLLKEEANKLVFSRGSGSGNLYYTTYLSTDLAVKETQPMDKGISISREYFSLNDPKKAITSIKRGELVRVRLTLVAPEALHYVVVEDPLPAGLEAVDASLRTETAVPTSYTVQDYRERGWGWWYFNHIELRDEKVVLSADSLPAGSYVYTYLARAGTAGTFQVIPPSAAEFYFPDVEGRGAGSVFSVQ